MPPYRAKLEIKAVFCQNFGAVSACSAASVIVRIFVFFLIFFFYFCLDAKKKKKNSFVFLLFFFLSKWLSHIRFVFSDFSFFFFFLPLFYLYVFLLARFFSYVWVYTCRLFVYACVPFFSYSLILNSVALSQLISLLLTIQHVVPQSLLKQLLVLGASYV